MSDLIRNPVAQSLTRDRLIQGMEPTPFILLLMVCASIIYVTFTRTLLNLLPIPLALVLFGVGCMALRRLAERDPMFCQLLLRRLARKDRYTPYGYDGRNSP